MTATLRGINGQTILESRILKIGRASDNHLVLNGPTVSAHHALICPAGQGYSIIDVGSTNGTFVNGERLLHNKERVLVSGDTIRIGATIFTYLYDAETTRALPQSAFSPDDSPTRSERNDENRSVNAPYPIFSTPPPPPPIQQSVSERLASGYQQYPGQPYGVPPAPYAHTDADVSPEQLQFTAFHPKAVAVGIWQTLLVYAHIESALALVRADAARFLAEMGPLPGEVSTGAHIPLLRGTEITIVPACSGIIFTPERVTFKWVKDWHPTTFRFQVHERLAGSAENGEIAVYAGPLLIATLKIAFLFEQQISYPANFSSASMSPVGKDSVTEVSARLYKKIFTSYSRADTPVILACKNVYRALGFQVLMDIDALRSGQNWNPALMKLIDESDIFQLFWSPRSARSQYVRQEWEYALQHDKGEGFIRPVYWKKPLMPPPDELSMLHFAYLQLPRLRITDYGPLFSWSIASIFKRKV